MRNLFKLALLATLFVALTITPALAKKKAPVDRTVIDGVTLALVKPGSQMQPYYPATARTSKLHAEVIVSVQVLENGKVGDVDVLSASVPDVGFEQSAADAVKHWRFHPALENDAPVETVTLVRLSFAPPTLKFPEGFIFVETSARSYSKAFVNTFMDRAWMDDFRNTTANDDARSRMQAYDSIPCNPGDRNECIYDKNEMSQFNGSSVTSRNPHNTPATSAPPTARRGGGR